MSKELITKKDYEILGIKENSTPNEIGSAYEKLLQEYHPEKIKLEKYREPNDLEIKKYKEVEKVYKKFDLEHQKYKCLGWRDNGFCPNRFFPCLWEKVENGERHMFCSRECYNSKYEFKSQYDELVEKHKREDVEWEKKKLAEAKRYLEEVKVQEINNIKKYLERAKVKEEELEPNNRNYEQEINQFEIKEADDSKWVKPLYAIINRIEKDIQSKSKRDLQTCDYCQKSFKGKWDGHGYVSYGAVGKDGHYTFCSEECREKGMKDKWITVKRKNPFTELLKWMEKEGIANISLDPNNGKLTLEYGKNNSKTIEDDNLTSEQREIKSFFQQIGKTSLSQNEARERAGAEEKGNNDNKWVKPLVIGGIVVLFITLIGIIIYKNKKKGY